MIGGLAAIFGMSVLNFVLSRVLWTKGILIGIALVLGAAFGFDGLRKLFRRKYGLNAAKFFLCAYVPSIVSAGIQIVAVFVFLLGGLGNLFIAVFYIFTSAALAAEGGIWLAVSAAVDRRKGNSI